MSAGPDRNYANSPWAKGLCDRCGQTFRLRMLRSEIYDSRPNGLLVCPTCLDKDHPQLRLGRTRIIDPIALFNPRPDLDKLSSTSFFGWNPVGNPTSSTVYCAIGTVRVQV